MSTHWSESLPKIACSGAADWARTQPSASAAWKSCERGDWMLWLLGKLSDNPDSVSRRKLVLVACACARLSLKHVRKGEERPRIAIETAEAWARGDGGITREQVRSAAAAYYAAYAAAAYAAAAAVAAAAVAVAAAYAADAAYAAAIAAATAAYAYAADAYAADAYAAAKKDALKECADIVRKHYPKPPRLT